jgi:hypothetical protein
MSTDATTTDGGTSGTPQQRDDASSAAERLGGPIEDEQTPDTARSTETSDDRQADRVADEDEQRPDTARSTETSDDRQADRVADESEQRPDTARSTETSDDRQADRVADESEQRPDTARRAETSDDRQADTGARQRTTLIPPEQAESYNSRWNELKSEFVDEPRRAVRGANELVGEVLDELEELFRRQRADLEHGLDSEQTTTEDLRQALGRYRSFFDRLLSF